MTLISPAGRQVSRAVAHADGAYGVRAPMAGSYVLITSADGHRPQASALAVGGEPVVHDVLMGGMSGLTGVVRSAHGGAPISGAVVIVTDVRGDVLATAEADARGEFGFAELVPGTMTLAVSSAEHRPRAMPVEIGDGGVTRVEVELHPGAHVRGAVRGAGVPLGGARVTLVDAAGNTVATTTTGPDGTYAFSDLDGGAYTVIATGYPPKATAVTVSGGGLDGHDIDLADGEA
ncbi:collagen binding domain-containing protein [Actinomadura sp. WMMB 499]|uniref:MSCRAMM family protein n=1 Tax=Actinomadura sp. WMMB 499 TaxID=1219491 RepID=UPI0020C81B4B|nr:carboxypeptidase-like regulatory domain-containing protein [Actinomadura sp. WMMB 499]